MKANVGGRRSNEDSNRYVDSKVINQVKVFVRVGWIVYYAC
jgi:hypothetical protein